MAAALNSVMIILQRIQHHPRPPITIEKQQMESLCEIISFLQDFLENHSHGDIGDSLERQIADAAYAAEDIIQSHIVDQILAEKSSHYDLFCQDLQKVIEDMDLIKKEVVKIQEKIGGIDDDQLPRNIITTSANIIGSSTVPPPKRKRTNTTVGFDDVPEQIMDRLSGHPPNRQVLPIVGMGGIGMNPRGRGYPTNKRGRARGRRGIISQIGNQILVNEKIATMGNTPMNPEIPFNKEFMGFVKEKPKDNTQSPSYASVITEEDNEESLYIQNPKKELILLLENKDIKWKDEPWTLMQRYLDTVPYTMFSYKQRIFYENILISTGSCEISHFTPVKNKQVYNFSKMVIKNIISAEDWGMSTLREKEFTHPELKIQMKFNFWDYTEAFEKVLFYENARKKHSWFIKICSKNYKREFPNWFHKWWVSYGPSIKILPDPYKDYYMEWINVSPKLIEIQHHNQWIEGIASLNFFTEFSIPWIMRWIPEFGYNSQHIPCIQRVTFSKFWNKMIQKDKETGLFQAQDQMNDIVATIDKYKEQILLKQKRESPSPFEHITQKLQMQEGNISKEKVIEEYVNQMKKDIQKYFGSKSDTSMASSSKGDNQFTCLAGESQDLNKEDEVQIEDIFSIMKKEMIEKIGSQQSKKDKAPM